MYVDQAQIESLFGGFVEQKQDAVFPHTKQRLQWSADTNLERVLSCKT